MSPGVGKTYAMLQAARQKQAEGCEVVVGIVETHGRKETEALLEGMPIMPRDADRISRHNARRRWISTPSSRWHPGLAVVDELAHTNAPGSRHPKRYQDVLELLDAGIDVYTHAQRSARRQPQRRCPADQRRHRAAKRFLIRFSILPTKSSLSI